MEPYATAAQPGPLNGNRPQETVVTLPFSTNIKPRFYTVLLS